MGHEIIDLDLDEMKIISWLRKLREYGWGNLTVVIQFGEIQTIKPEFIIKRNHEQRKIFEEVK